MKINELARNRQFRLLAMVSGAIAAVTTVVIVVYKSTQPQDISSQKQYKSTFSTGAEELSDREMWIERSTNDLADLKNQNRRLQEQLEAVQKVVIGVAKYLHADDSPDKSPDTPNETESQPNRQEPEMESFSGMSDFVNQAKHGAEAPAGFTSDNREQEKGISTITFANDGEYDENFIFASTYARCVLVGSVTVSAGIGASSNPQPVLLRLTDTGNLPNQVKGFLKDAMIIGAAYGELSSESVIIRLERITKIDKKRGIGIDLPVQGYVAGENGDSRIRGIVIDRAGAVIRNVAVGGFFSGMGNFFTASGSSVRFEPNSGLAQFSPEKGAKMLEQGASKGIGNAVEKYADFYIKRAEQLQPVIKIDGGRKLMVVFTQSVKASSVHMKKVRSNLHEKNRI